MDSENVSDSRTIDFQNGETAMEGNDFDSAIENFQKCMKKLSNQGLGLTSDLFPKCLQNIAVCYEEKDDMENALSFKRFEKLYYETVLLHNGLDGLTMKELNGFNVGQEGDSSRDRGDGSSEPFSQQSAGLESQEENEDSTEDQTAKRASEYEQLAKLCLQQECVSLALEYSGKATLLQRHQFGDDHEKTKRSFELFTSIYAEAGKKQYSESMEQLNVETDGMPSSPATVEETLLRHRKNVKKETDGDGESKPLKRTRSILKKANGDQQAPESPRRVTFADPLPQMVRLRDEDENDNPTTNLLLFILICILIILVSLLLSAVFCHFKPTIGACIEFRREITYYFNKLRNLSRSFRR